MEEGKQRLCPYCRSYIPAGATVCRYCQRESEIDDQSDATLGGLETAPEETAKCPDGEHSWTYRDGRADICSKCLAVSRGVKQGSDVSYRRSMIAIIIVVAIIVGTSMLMLKRAQNDALHRVAAYQTHLAQLAYKAHLKRLSWQHSHPREYAEEVAARRAAVARQVAYEAEQRREAQARAAAAAVAAAHLIHGDPDCLVMDDRTMHAEYDDAGELYMYGTVQNRCDSTLSYVSVNVSIFDSSGTQVDSSIANTTYLQAGDSWRFQAISVSSSSGGGRWRVTSLEGTQ